MSPDDGTWNGSTAYSLTNAQFGAAAELDGNCYLVIPSNSNLERDGGSLTIFVWCRVGVWDQNWQCLLAKGEGNNYRVARFNADGQRIAYAGGTGDISGSAINGGDWHHIAAIFDAGEGTSFYVDGELVATGSAPSLADSGNPLFLGNNTDATARASIGGIDDVALFDRALSQQKALAVCRLGEEFGHSMGEAIQILDAHDEQGSITIRARIWSYSASDSGTETFIALAVDGSGVDVAMGPPISDFGASPRFIISGGSATLTWQVEPPFTELMINQGIGDVLPETNVSGSGSLVVSPTESTVYTLTATNPDGTSQRSTTVFVDVEPKAPRISEISADTASDGLRDEDGDTKDWLEIFNPGPEAAILADFFLTDDETMPTKWAFPAVTIPAESSLVVFVFASGKDRRVIIRGVSLQP